MRLIWLNVNEYIQDWRLLPICFSFIILLRAAIVWNHNKHIARLAIAVLTLTIFIYCGVPNISDSCKLACAFGLIGYLGIASLWFYLEIKTYVVRISTKRDLPF